MIQRPASGTLDLELCHLTDTGEKFFALSTSAIFQHSAKPLGFCQTPPRSRGE